MGVRRALFLGLVAVLFAKCMAEEKLIWSDEFDIFNTTVWDHLVTSWDGGNREFQYYRNNRKNSFVLNGVLNIRPTPTVEETSRSFLEEGTILDKDCNFLPCISVGGNDIVSPFFSARISTKNFFAFKYGRVEVRAKMPKGDWLWPAIWMLPEGYPYGGWPGSGEIDIAEVRANPDLKDEKGHQHGNSEVKSTLHFAGPQLEDKPRIGGSLNALPGKNFSDGFYTYELTWTPDFLRFKVDGRLIKEVNIPAGGFTELGGYPSNDLYKKGTKSAPFDGSFHFVLNVAVGGNFFPENWTSDGRKRPYDYGKRGPQRQFWDSRSSWINTWENPEDHSLQIDYIRVYQQEGGGGNEAVFERPPSSPTTG